MPAVKRRKQTRKTQKTTNSARVKSLDIVKRNIPATALGLAIVITVALLGFKIINRVSKTNQAKNSNTTIEKSPAPIRKESKTNGIVNKLPYTSSAVFFYTVENGDNLAKLGETFCSNKREWIRLAQINKLYPPYTLQIGEKIEISCN